MRAKFLVLIIVFTFLVSSCSSTTSPVSVVNIPTTANTQVASSTTAPSTVAYTPITLKMSMTKHTSFAPIFIAQAEGYFKDYGIDLQIVPASGATQTVALFVAGTVDIYGGTLNSGLINMIAKDSNIKVVADRGHFGSGECTYEAIVVRKDLYDSGKITSAKDLAGQTIASTATGPDAYILATYLAQAGLTLKDVSLNDVPNTSYIDAFNNKTIAAVVTPELNLSKLMAAGNAVILASAQDIIGNYQVSVLAFSKSITVDNPDAGARFLAAYLKGVQQYNLGKTDSNLQILSTATGEATDTLKNSCWLPINENASIDFSGVNGFQQWALSQGLIDSAVSENQFMDMSFLAAAQKLINK
ncbi:MAG: ABC transporter substrate-binding protein [Anaerolineaceae bacterium]